MRPRDHQMFESQVSATLTGSVARPESLISTRAGRVVYHARTTPQGMRQSQKAAGARVDPKLLERAHACIAELQTFLERFRDTDAGLTARVLVRRRQTGGRRGPLREYQSFWGALRLGGSWDSAFGCTEQGTPAFRRGPWEEWPRLLPALTHLDPSLPMVLSPYCGTLLHEALGHALEAEYLAHSPLKGRQGQLISHHDLTVMDRPDLAGLAGSMDFDDIGWQASATTLVHRGILVGDLSRGRGVWRRASFRDLPLVRASNFMVRPGSGDPDAWLAGMPRGYYVCWLQGGNWLPGSDRVKVLTGPVFYLEHGQPRAYLNWTSIEWQTLDLLARIVGVGRDFQVDPVVHWCMKQHQAVPMGLGMPSLLLRGEAT
ncbi:PmbA-TldD-C domain-containing protein [Sulfidibacter corallicola]|uniref:Metalloprotease TldD/E C-terminal domain-containing protein n=1 Tax=Sulfidibacter corallicola TaxID=2818388 RepID=A0A8A4TXT1_SULCO|nr:metallopeptidase TldD-related protein [Sulfidibacter corallicola]QTD54008.1 hypothetical protein J3U87_16300 [Sulfidibacter corallicola]